MPQQQSFCYVRTDLPGLNQYYARINVSCSRTQFSDVGEARTHGPSVLSQALYHTATALHMLLIYHIGPNKASPATCI